MHYERDFDTAQGWATPIEGIVFLGVTPLLLLLFALALLAVGVLSYRFGQARGGRDTNAPSDIWKAIDAKAKSAMAVDSLSLAGKAGALVNAVEERLAGTLAVAEIKPLLDAIQAAIDGKPAPHDHGHDDHGGGHDGAHGHDDHGHDGANSVSIANPVTVIVNGQAPGGHDPHGSHTLSPRERDHAIRNAVADFNDYWRHRDQRVEEMEDAAHELGGA